jgi:hypothetical protein
LGVFHVFLVEIRDDDDADGGGWCMMMDDG